MQDLAVAANNTTRIDKVHTYIYVYIFICISMQKVDRYIRTRSVKVQRGSIRAESSSEALYFDEISVMQSARRSTPTGPGQVYSFQGCT